MRRMLFTASCTLVAVAAGVAVSLTFEGCNSSPANGGKDASIPDMTTPPDLEPCTSFNPTPECLPTTLPVQPLMGSRGLVMSSLRIADFNEGFDLNCDGVVDNKLAPLGTVANPEIADSFSHGHNIILPIELFGYNGTANDCTKFAFYVGRINEDKDGDGYYTSWEAGKADCDDTDPSIHPGAAEFVTGGDGGMVGDHVDNNCNGLADETGMSTPASDMVDHDGDGYSVHDGDCDDRSDPAHIDIAKTKHPGAKEICANGIDEDCDGIADHDKTDSTACDPFGGVYEPISHVGLLSFSNAPDAGTTSAVGLTPYIVFPDATVKTFVQPDGGSSLCTGGTACYNLNAGPDLFSLSLDIQDFMVTLKLSGARVSMVLNEEANGTFVTKGLLAGVLEAQTLAQIHISAGSIISAQQSLLDAIFVGAAGTILGLATDENGHYLPDIDVDGDGLETFWQVDMSAPDGSAPIARIDHCQDGDGTIVTGLDCPFAIGPNGKPRFVDGISAALKFTAVPSKIADLTSVGIGQ